MPAASSSPINFFMGEIGSISSLAPIKNMMMKADRIYLRSPKKLKGVQSMTENIVPAKMPMPPKEGVLT